MAHRIYECLKRVDLRTQPRQIPADTDGMPTLDLPIEVVDLTEAVLCACAPTALCPTCREQNWLRAKGTVACRGEHFVEVHRRLPTADEAAHAVADLAEDPDLAMQMAAEWLRWAERRWQRARRDAGDWMWRR